MVKMPWEYGAFGYFTPLAEKMLGLQKKVADGTATEEEQAEYRIWQPFIIPVEPITLEKLLLALVVARYLKDEAGRKQLAEIAKKYLTVVGDTMSALASAGAANPFASLIHGRITVEVYRTLGLINPHMANVLSSNFEDAINKMFVGKYLEGMSGLGTMVFGKAGAVAALRPTPSP